MLNKLLVKFPFFRKVPFLNSVLIKSTLEPVFFIVGFQKCGTTTLYDAITSHPDVLPGNMKENDILAEKADRIDEFRLCFPSKLRGKITGDASHLHTWMPYGLNRIKKYFPKAKILVIMRNPIDRAYSHFNMDQKIGYLPMSMTFDHMVDIEFTLRKNLKDNNSADEMYEQMRFYGNKYGWPLSRGLYHLYLEKLEALELTYLPIFLEELNADFSGTMQKVFEYLELRPITLSEVKSNKGQYDSSLPSDLQKLLEDFYHIPNKKLSALLNRNLPW